LLSKLLYNNEISLDIKLDIYNVRDSIEKYSTSVNFIYNTHFKKSDGSIKTFKELLLTLNDDRTILLPILLNILFKSSITGSIRSALFSKYRT